jgi:hypothetical protein
VVAQGFFEAGKDSLVISCLDMDNPVRREPSRRQRGREQILAALSPQHLAPGPRCDPGGKECSGSAVDRAVASTGHFVQSAERQAAFGQMLINGLDAERQYCPPMPRAALKASNALAKRVNGGNMERCAHCSCDLSPRPTVHYLFSLSACQSTRPWWRPWELSVMPIPLLSPEQRRVLALLVSAGRDGVTQERLNAFGFEPGMIAGLVNQGLATLTSSRVYSGGKMIEIARVRIKAVGRRAIKE